MRRILLAVIVLGTAAACADQPTGPEDMDPAVPGPALVRVGEPATVAPIPFILGPVRSLGTTTTTYDYFRAANRPQADLGGDRVVWQYREDPDWWFGSIHQIRVSTGARSQLGDFQSGGDPHISPDGRYSAWIDGTGIVLLDHVTGARRRVPAINPRIESMVFAGGRLLFMDQPTQITRSLVLFDIASGTSRTVVESGAGKEYPSVRADAFDGRYVVFPVPLPRLQGDELMAYDTRTGRTFQVAPLVPGSFITGMWADGGRVVYACDVPGGRAVFVSDIATGATRTIYGGPLPAVNLRMAGDLVTWADSRNDHGGSPFIYNYDVFVYDLAANVEIPVASTAAWESDARVNGNRVLWVAWNGSAWELRIREVTPVTLPVLQAEVRSMAASGAIHNAGVARSLEALLSTAASMQRRSREKAIQGVRQFTTLVAQHSGKQIDAAAAQRLQGMAAAAIARM